MAVCIPRTVERPARAKHSHEQEQEQHIHSALRGEEMCSSGDLDRRHIRSVITCRLDAALQISRTGLADPVRGSEKRLRIYKYDGVVR